MKALVYTGAETLEYKEAPDAIPRDNEVLVRVDSVGICGSDMHAYLGHDERRPAPLILGHEAAGVVIGGPEDGRRVTVNPLVTCGQCPACVSGRNNLCPERQIISMPPREGAFAEYLAMPAQNLVTVPDAFPLDTAALAEPLACGWHAVRLGISALQNTSADLKCVVLGGGAIGLASALALAAAGIDRIAIAETNRLRHGAISNAGPFDVYDPIGDVAPYADGEADLVIDAVGFAATRADASRLVRPGGVIVHIGLGDNSGGLDVRRVTLQEVTFIGTYTYTPDDFRQTTTAMFDGRLGTLDWFDTRPLSDGAPAFSDIRDGSVAASKIVLKPGL